MKIVVISDTHGQHSYLDLPSGDLIIHCGDVSKRGSEEEIIDFLNWFESLHFKHKVFIAGNHDFYFERAGMDEIQRMIPTGVIYLNDTSVQIEHLTLWGSPITPWFYDWAFNRHRGSDIKKHWDLIPTNADIIITHGPVSGILDKTVNNDHAGCADLYKRISEVKPKVHLCGHIHEAYGSRFVNDTHFINASVLNENYYLVNRPIEFEL